jgi:hypothetical protein
MGFKDWYENGTRWIVGNRIRVRFWHAVWLDNYPLRIRFPRLYRINRQQELSVAAMYEVDRPGPGGCELSNRTGPSRPWGPIPQVCIRIHKLAGNWYTILVQ